MGVWTTSASWEWPRSFSRTWTCLPQSAAGTSCSLPPLWQTPASDPSPDASPSRPWRAQPAHHAPRHPGYTLMHKRRQSRADADTCTVYTQQLYFKSNTGRCTRNTPQHTCQHSFAPVHEDTVDKHLIPSAHTHTNMLPYPLPLQYSLLCTHISTQ